jgi:hypothetical protein
MVPAVERDRLRPPRERLRLANAASPRSDRRWANLMAELEGYRGERPLSKSSPRDAGQAGATVHGRGRSRTVVLLYLCERGI